jgi:hypothetical protein
MQDLDSYYYFTGSDCCLMPTEQFFSYTMASEINWNSPAGKTIIWNQPSGHVVQIKQIGLEH